MKSPTADHLQQEHLQRDKSEVPEAAVKKKEARPSKYPPIWSEEIAELESFFQSVSLPGKIQLSKHETIYRPAEFIAAHLSTVKNNNGNPYFLAYLERLRKVKQLLKNN